MVKSIWKSEDERFETFEKENGKTYVIQKKGSFRDFIEKNRYWADFMSLDDSDKRKLLRRYKHGLTDDNANAAIESTQQYILRNLVLPEDLRENSYYNNIKRFNDYCYKIMQEIGLTSI